jgi:Tfp pilus assembly protein PilX
MNSEKGAILVVVIMLLAFLSILGVSSIEMRGFFDRNEQYRT